MILNSSETSGALSNGRILKRGVYKIFWRSKGGFERTPLNPPCLRACSISQNMSSIRQGSRLLMYAYPHIVYYYAENTEIYQSWFTVYCELHFFHYGCDYQNYIPTVYCLDGGSCYTCVYLMLPNIAARDEISQAFSLCI